MARGFLFGRTNGSRLQQRTKLSPPRSLLMINLESRRLLTDVVRSLFLPFEARTILNIPLCHSLPEDQIIWVGNRRGEFSVKSAYYIAYGLLNTLDEGECSIGDSINPL